jgi:uncharacterized membrane protein YeaQ/YmgE (transglycosylase-associated protein family)
LAVGSKIEGQRSKVKNQSSKDQIENEDESMLWNIISWIVFGFIAGLIARVIMPGKDPGGFIITTLLGIGGAFVGGFVARFLGIGSASRAIGDRGFLRQLVIAVIGSIIILAIHRFWSSSK